MPDSFINPAPHIKPAVSIISGKFAEINAVPVFDECDRLWQLLTTSAFPCFSSWASKGSRRSEGKERYVVLDTGQAYTTACLYNWSHGAINEHNFHCSHS